MRRSGVGTAAVLGRRVGPPAESAGLSGGGDAAPESERDSAPSGREGPYRQEEAAAAAVEQQERRSREPRHVTARKAEAGRAQNSQRSALRARAFL